MMVPIEAQADEHRPVKLLPSIVAVDCSMHPDGYTGERRGNTAFGKHRNEPRRELSEHRNGMLGGVWRLKEWGEPRSIEKQRRVLDDRTTDSHDEGVCPLRARHRRHVLPRAAL